MPATVTADTEYDPNLPSTWAVRDDANGWNDGTRVYIQAPPSDVPDTDKQFIDAETDNLCVETFSWGEVNVYPEDVDPSSMEHDIRHEYEGNSSEVPLWWITELLMDEGYIEDGGELDDEIEQEMDELIREMETHTASESTPNAAELVAESVSTDGIVDAPNVKEVAEAAYMDAVNEYTSMGSMSKLEERTARRKFERWWQRNYGEE